MKFGQLLHILRNNNKEIFLISQNLPEYNSLGVRHGNFIRIDTREERLQEYLEYDILDITTFNGLVSVAI